MRCCARCGAERLVSPASHTIGGVTAYYCDPEDATEATCFFLSKYAGFPELREVLDQR